MNNKANVSYMGTQQLTPTRTDLQREQKMQATRPAQPLNRLERRIAQKLKRCPGKVQHDQGHAKVIR